MLFMGAVTKEGEIACVTEFLTQTLEHLIDTEGPTLTTLRKLDLARDIALGACGL